MYYVFRDDMMVWNGKPLHAKAMTKITLREYGQHWWKCRPLEKPLPLLNFAIDEKAPRLDNYFTGMSLDLYSDRLIEIISNFSIMFEVFPANLINSKTGQVISSKYKIFHLLQIASGLDVKRSQIENNVIRKVVLQKNIVTNGMPFFRLAELAQVVLIRSDLKEKLDALSISGCKYTPIEDYQVGVLPRI